CPLRSKQILCHHIKGRISGAFLTMGQNLCVVFVRGAPKQVRRISICCLQQGFFYFVLFTAFSM
ncbi:MAG TPA: hypothetical protein VKZ92_01785, partial [Pseudohongiella sp.]|nr:hypothetical protein [Pseudohongiella sp.]